MYENIQSLTLQSSVCVKQSEDFAKAPLFSMG